MNKPEPMTDAEIARIFSAHSMALLPHRKNAAADLIAARDAQWEQMLAGQEPVAWRYQNSNTDNEYLVWQYSDAGGRNWTPLYAAPQPAQEEQK